MSLSEITDKHMSRTFSYIFLLKPHHCCWHPLPSQTSAWNQFQSLIKTCVDDASSFRLRQAVWPPSLSRGLTSQHSSPPSAHVLLHVSVLSGVPKAKPFMDCPPPTTLFTHRMRLRSPLTVYRLTSDRPDGGRLLSSRARPLPSCLKMFACADPPTCDVFFSRPSMSKPRLAPRLSLGASPWGPL